MKLKGINPLEQHVEKIVLGNILQKSKWDHAPVARPYCGHHVVALTEIGVQH